MTLPFIASWISDSWSWFSSLWDDGWDWLHYPLITLGDTAITLFSLLKGVLVVLFAFWASKLIRKGLMRLASRQTRIESSTFYVLARLTHYFVITFGIIIALVSLGLNFTNFALIAGALSVGIGFGLQTIVNNFLCGLIILFEGALKVGDFLELESGVSGRISEINVRSCVIRTNDGIEVIIPNAEIVGRQVINWTMSDAYRRVHVPFTVAYGTDKSLVKKAALESAERVVHTLKGLTKYPAPRVSILAFGDNGMQFELVVWVNARASRRLASTRGDYLWELHNSFLEYGIEIPIPQSEVSFKTPLPDSTPSKATI